MSTKPCPTCGELLPANALFCGNCGTRLQPPAPAAQSNAGPVQPGPTPFFDPPPQGFSAPPQSPASFPPPPAQPGGGPPPQGFGPPPQPGGPPPQGFNAPPQSGGPAMPPPPQGFSGPPQPGGPAMPPPPQGFAGPIQPGAPGGAMPPAPRPTPKKRRTGLMVALVVVVVVVLVVGVGGVLLLTKGTPKSNSSTNTGSGGGGGGSATATPSTPAGFQQFKNSTFSILYPTGWQAQETPIQQGSEEKFLGPAGAVSRSLTVDVFDKTRPPKEEDDALCLGFSGNPTAQVTPTTATLGGQQWTREDCAARNVPGAPTLKATVESVIYKNKLYTISYVSSPDATFAKDRSTYYTPMEQSFKFLT